MPSCSCGLGISSAWLDWQENECGCLCRSPVPALLHTCADTDELCLQEEDPVEASMAVANATPSRKQLLLEILQIPHWNSVVSEAFGLWVLRGKQWCLVLVLCSCAAWIQICSGFVCLRS